jgi:glycosyltransferase involved in cell wall biosynthesis
MYNAQAWIEETLASVLAQTYPAGRIETIIVDDRSSDDSVNVARAFIARHRMRATVVMCDCNNGVSAARNVGWRAATGDWIQFLDADDLLAPNKLELQTGMLPHIGDDVAVICSSWQRLGRFRGKWQPYGEITRPELDQSVILRIVTINAGFLGPALIRKRFLEAVGGFCELVVYAEDSHLMLKLAAAGGGFVETPAASPLFFIRQTPGSMSRRSWVKVAHQHLANMVIAERMLRHRFGDLSAEHRKEVGKLSGWALSELYEHDRDAFRRYLQWLRSLGLAIVPEHSTKLKLATLLLGYENALRVATTYHRLRARGNPVLAVLVADPAIEAGLLLCAGY